MTTPAAQVLTPIPCPRCGRPVAQRYPDGSVAIAYDKLRGHVAPWGKLTCTRRLRVTNPDGSVTWVDCGGAARLAAPVVS